MNFNVNLSLSLACINTLTSSRGAGSLHVAGDTKTAGRKEDLGHAPIVAGVDDHETARCRGARNTCSAAGSWSPPTALMLRCTRRVRARPRQALYPRRRYGMDLRPSADRRLIVDTDDRSSRSMIDRRERSSNHDLRPPTPMIARRDR